MTMRKLRLDTGTPAKRGGKVLYTNIAGEVLTLQIKSASRDPLESTHPLASKKGWLLRCVDHDERRFFYLDPCDPNIQFL